jgi:uncharacterized protein
MDKNKVISDAESYIKQLLGQETTGHDYDHAFRVYQTALKIQRAEGGNLFLISLSAWLHDADDVKLFPDEKGEERHASAFLEKEGVDEEDIRTIIRIISEISFKGEDSVKPKTLEGQIVQDADRLDALGAMGIARTFAYGGAKGRKIYDPEVKPVLSMDEKTYRNHVSTSVNHFYEKLFKLKDLMNTKTAYQMAVRRERFMKDYLAEFYLEAEGKD